MGTPDLVVEVISPSNSYIDRYSKKTKYEQFGVKEYWIADPANQTLEIFTLGPAGNYELFLFLPQRGEVRSNILPNLDFDLSEVFNKLL